MKLGKPEVSLSVASLKSSLTFYESLGFARAEGKEDEKWMVLEKEALRIGLYEGHIEENLITFFGGEVAEIAQKLHAGGYELQSGPATEDDGSLGAKVVDPDGNLLYFNA
jgi:predicted lactoylglutathione lyase